MQDGKPKGNIYTGFGNMLLNREISKGGAMRLLDFVHDRSLRNLQLSTTVEIQSTLRSPTNCLSLEKVEYRYLLSGALNGTVCLFDLEISSSVVSDQKSILLPLLQHVPNTGHVGGVRGTGSTISSLQWYPEDSGAFLTASMNGRVSIFDTNYFVPVGDFGFDQVVYSARMRSGGSESVLIAVALQDGTVRLCDPRTRDTSHVLKGHDRSVTCVDWCPSVGSAFMLASAGMDGAVRFWDVRKAGSVSDAVVLSLDWRGDFTSASKIDERKLYTSLTTSTDSRGVLIRDASQPYRAMGESASTGGESSLRAGRAHDGGAMSMRYTSCGNFVVTSGNDQRLRLWEAHTGNLVSINYSDNIVPVSQLPYDIGIAELSYASADILLVPASGNCSVAGSNFGVEGDVRTTEGDILMIPAHSQDGQPIRLLKGHLERVTALAYRKPQQQVISAARDGMIFLWTSLRNRCTGVGEDRGSHQDQRENSRQHRLYFGSSSGRYDYQQVLNSVEHITPGRSTTASAQRLLRRPQLLPAQVGDDTNCDFDGVQGVMMSCGNSVSSSDESGDAWSDEDVVPVAAAAPLRNQGKKRKNSAWSIINAAGASQSDTVATNAVEERQLAPNPTAQSEPTKRSFIPPIVQQYLQDASRDTLVAAAQDINAHPSSSSCSSSQRDLAQWSTIDDVFQAPVRAVSMHGPPSASGDSSTLSLGPNPPLRSATAPSRATNDARTADQRYAQWVKQMRSKSGKKK